MFYYFLSSFLIVFHFSFLLLFLVSCFRDLVDYGGHDSRFTGNIVYHGHNDGQNCVNTWPFLPGHGAVYTGNKCILPRSTNIGNVGDGIVPGCATCPGEKKDLQPWNPIYTTDTWRAFGGIDFYANEYFTSDPSATSVNCDCVVDPAFPGSCGKNPPGYVTRLTEGLCTLPSMLLLVIFFANNWFL